MGELASNFCGGCKIKEMGFCGGCTEGVSPEEADQRAFEEAVWGEPDIAVDVQLNRGGIGDDLAGLAKRLGIDPETLGL